MEPAKVKSSVNYLKSVYGGNFAKYVTSTYEKEGVHMMSAEGKKAVSAWFKKTMKLPLQ